MVEIPGMKKVGTCSSPRSFRNTGCYSAKILPASGFVSFHMSALIPLICLHLALEPDST